MKNLEKMEKPLGGVLLFLLMLSIGFSESSDQPKNDEVLLKCCTAGEEFAAKESGCKGFQPPSVEPELIGACFFSAEICCNSKLRIEQCKTGVQAAKAGADCHNADNRTGGEFYKNCCEACKVGMVLGGIQEECSMGVLYGTPFDDSYNYCCNEMKSTDTFVLTDDDNVCTKFDNLCSQICEATDESYICKCEKGYKLDGDKKTCILEDSESVTEKSNEVPINSTDDCPSGYAKNEQNGQCDDIDECESTDVTCDMETQVCHNVPGSYKCLNVYPLSNTCPTGFTFDPQIKQCIDINECELGTGKCPGVYECMNIPGGYDCVEPNRSTTSTHETQTFTPHKKNLTCSKGFKQQLNKCVDIDECATDKTACDSNQNCLNVPGSFRCECKIGFTMDRVVNACVDINECQINNHDCLDTQRCDNTIGSYTCIRLQSCGTGYTLNAETGYCDDDDECALGRHNCHKPFECRNTKGSFRCEKPRATTTTSTTTTSTTTTTTKRPYVHTQNYQPTYTQTYSSRYNVWPYSTTENPRNMEYDQLYGPCNEGLQRNNQGACIDIDECLYSNSCRRNQRCINTNGSYKCQNLLACSGGYTSNDEGTQCIDIDECALRTATCGPDEICKNKPGGYTCQCPAGHAINAQKRCEDINECEFYRGKICSSNSECVNTIGSFRCECKDGFKRQGSDDKICIDVNECEEIPGMCEQRCINYWGSFRCACETGFRLSDNNRTCEDIDECEVHKSYNLCLGLCENTRGSYRCACPPGYTLGPDGRSCQDIDECATQNVCSSPDAICTNLRGSYRCTYKNCPPDYINDSSHKNRCKRMSLTCEHGDIECYRRPASITYHFITLVSNMSLPPTGRVLFTYKGPSWYENIDFDLKVLHAQAPGNIRRANEKFFSMDKYQNEARLSLMESLEGPQDIEIEMSMTVFRDGQPSGTNVAKIFIFVSEYQY